MRILGRFLVAGGLLVAVFGVMVLVALTGIAENRTGLDTFSAFLTGLFFTALFATPGILLALVGSVLVRTSRSPEEERLPRSSAPAWTLATVAVVAWAGVALSISTTHNANSSSAPPPKPRSLAQQRADNVRFMAEDAARHPIPAGALRHAEHRVGVVLRKRRTRRVVLVRCKHQSGWGVMCLVRLKARGEPTARFGVIGDYIPSSREIHFDPPLSTLANY